MKDVRKIYGQFQILQRNNENTLTKITYSSLQKYNKSPYLQRVVQHSYKKNLKREQTPLKIQIEEQQSSTQFKKQLQKTKHQLPKLTTPIKFKEGDVISLFKTQTPSLGNPLSKNKQTAGSHSATLEVYSSKKQKLQPITRANKIHFITKTKAGTTGKQTKINQDMAIVEMRFPFGIKLFSVCDGHGLNGHLVSSFIKTHFLKNLNSSFKKLTSPPTTDQLKAIIQTTIHKTNLQLLECDINTQLSGSTFVAVFIYNDKAISFNVGDSRAIIAKQLPVNNPTIQQSSQMQEKNSLSEGFKMKKLVNYDWKVLQLTIDQKPDRPDQKQRILNAGGRVFSQRNQKGDQIGPQRVWMKEVMMPGLAMSRSMGDKAGIKAGTNAQPQIQEFDLTEQDKFLVVASDGIWQYLQNHEVVTLIAPYYVKDDLDMAGERLIKIASEIWHKVSLSRDDITVIIVSLHAPIS